MSSAAARSGLEGKSPLAQRGDRIRDYETALACYQSPEYQANIKLRLPHSNADLIVMEGYDGPQPARNRQVHRLPERPAPAIGREEVSHGRHAFDRCGGRRPDGPRVDRASFRRRPGAVVTGALEAPGSELLGKDAGVLAGLPANGVQLSADLWALSANADGILDFTVPAATIANVAIAAERGLVHIVGTTGLSASDMAVIKSVDAARRRREVRQYESRRQSARRVGEAGRAVARTKSFDIEIVEMHHKAKIDAPSGTALLLGEAAAAGRGVDLDTRSARGRDGMTGARRPGDIGFASLRGGTVTGDHSVIFAGADGAHRTDAPGRGPDHVRARRRESRAVGARQAAGFLHDDRRAGLDDF